MPISTRSLQLASAAGRTSWATRCSKAYLLEPVTPAGANWSPASIGRLRQPEQIGALRLSTQRHRPQPAGTVHESPTAGPTEKQGEQSAQGVSCRERVRHE